MVKEFQAQVPNSAIVECNTLYAGDRYTTEGHRETL
ncbi:MAG: (Fe-S)-binding protein, partial [Selenomonadaceae bacterium]|nr:(Fe-S)-binding protein [Selenomonadaceae bacterium]